jgi:excisionase family DNA binding protein
MENITFEGLPQAVAQLHERLSSIEGLLRQAHFREEAEQVLSVSQAARFLNLSVSTLYGKSSRREVPVSKRGKRLYFRRSELEEWIREGRRKTMDELRDQVPERIGRRSR